MRAEKKETAHSNEVDGTILKGIRHPQDIEKERNEQTTPVEVHITTGVAETSKESYLKNLRTSAFTYYQEKIIARLNKLKSPTTYKHLSKTIKRKGSLTENVPESSLSLPMKQLIAKNLASQLPEKMVCKLGKNNAWHFEITNKGRKYVESGFEDEVLKSEAHTVIIDGNMQPQLFNNYGQAGKEVKDGR